jgi:hypothetical protein
MDLIVGVRPVDSARQERGRLWSECRLDEADARCGGVGCDPLENALYGAWDGELRADPRPSALPNESETVSAQNRWREVTSD